MTENWAAVARAIQRRMTELGVTQRELIERSRVSKAVVREIQHNTAQRRRSTRTLEALSVALEWHSGHLTAVAGGRRPPKSDEPAPRSRDDIAGRLDVIEHHLRGITDRLTEIEEVKERLDTLNANLAGVVEHVNVDRNRHDR